MNDERLGKRAHFDEDYAQLIGEFDIAEEDENRTNEEIKELFIQRVRQSVSEMKTPLFLKF